MWSQFHQLRISTLPHLWNDFLQAEVLPPVSPLLLQSVNQHLLESLFIEHERMSTSNAAECSTTSQSTVISKEEANAMRCGFVPYRLLRRYEKNSDEKSIQFVECLGNMAAAGMETNILDYTKEWFDAVNRGGLFPLNDETFMFFTAVEGRVRAQLVKSVLPSEFCSSNCKESTLQHCGMTMCNFTGVSYQLILKMKTMQCNFFKKLSAYGYM